MKIQKIIKQHRRDFTAVMECEHCGATKINWHGYDDDNYHQNVVPQMKCEACGETAPNDYRPLATKYPEGVQV